MAKKKEDGTEEKILTESKSSPGISVDKFLQLYGGAIHPYTQAYVTEQFRGIMKPVEEWNKELKIHMGGEK